MSNFENLTYFEMLEIGGGETPKKVEKKDTSFWYDVAFLAGAIIGGILTMGIEGGKSQQSLPATLKK